MVMPSSLIFGPKEPLSGPLGKQTGKAASAARIQPFAAAYAKQVSYRQGFVRFFAGISRFAPHRTDANRLVSDSAGGAFDDRAM
jgi:hypothetical protein